MPPLTLYLQIFSCKCSCGNQWTHSSPILRAIDGSIGGTPSPNEQLKLPLTHLLPTTRHYHHCFRCAPLGLGIGWQIELPKNPNPTKRPLSLDQLENEIFSREPLK